MEKEIGELTGKLFYIADSINKLTNAVEKNNEVAADFREHVVGELSTIKAQIIPYMEKCDEERNQLEDRTKKLELRASRQSGQLSILMTLAIAVGSMMGVVLDNIGNIKSIFR